MQSLLELAWPSSCSCGGAFFLFFSLSVSLFYQRWQGIGICSSRFLSAFNVVVEKISQDGSCACSMSCFVALLSYGLTFFVSTAPVDQCDIIGYAVFFVVTGESQTWEVTGERSQVRVRGEMWEVSGGRWDVRVLCDCSHVAFCGWICVWILSAFGWHS